MQETPLFRKHFKHVSMVKFSSFFIIEKFPFLNFHAASALEIKEENEGMHNVM